MTESFLARHPVGKSVVNVSVAAYGIVMCRHRTLGT